MNAIIALLAAAVVLTPDSEIVVAKDAPAATRLAADELGFFMKGVFGHPLPVVAGRTPGKTAMILGGAVPEGLGVDGFVIDAKDGAVRIVGEDGDAADLNKTAFLADEAPWQVCFRRGTLFGVYDFLERHAGVRMYFPGELGTIVPRAERIAVPEGRRSVEPVFTVRRYGFEDGKVPQEVLAATPEGTEVAAKRLNWYRLRMETQHIPCCHGNRWNHLLERFHETHPEYFVLKPNKDGKLERDVSFPTRTDRHKGHLGGLGGDIRGREGVLRRHAGVGARHPRRQVGAEHERKLVRPDAAGRHELDTQLPVRRVHEGARPLGGEKEEQPFRERPHLAAHV